MINNPALGGFGNQSGVEFLGKLMPALVSAIMVIGVVIFLFTFLLGAIEYVSSGGDKGKAESAKQKLTNALIGIVVLLGFFAILSLIECFFGIGLRNIEIGPFNVSLSGNPMCTGGTTGSTGGNGTGTTLGSGTGNALCSGCISGGCGIPGDVYLGTGTQNYLCQTAPGGWTPTSSSVTSTTCGTCN